MTIHEWKQLPLLHLHLFIPFKILLRDTNLFTEHFLGFPAYIDLRDIAGDIECVRFEGHLLDIWIEAAGTAHTDFIASHDVRHEHLVVDGLTLFTLPYQKILELFLFCQDPYIDLWGGRQSVMKTNAQSLENKPYKRIKTMRLKEMF